MQKNKDKDYKKINPLNPYLRFSSIAIQMAVIITAGAIGGDWLDKKQENDFPVWTLCLSLFAIFTSLYLIIKEVIKIGKEEKKNKKT